MWRTSGGIHFRIPPEDLTKVCRGYGNFFLVARETRASVRAELLNSDELFQPTQKAVGGGKTTIGSDFISGLTVQARLAGN